MAWETGKTSEQLKKWYANMRSRSGKLKQTPPSSDTTELTTRDSWILRQFYMCFVDFKKVFDSISHDKLWITMMAVSYTHLTLPTIYSV